MGTDIHIYAERKLQDGQWAMERKFEGNSVKSFDVNPEELSNNYSSWCRPTISGRNYRFFAALAGVRGDGPDARGLPKDVSPFVAEEAISWGGNGHTHSWMSARELIPIFMRHKMPEEDVVKITKDRLDGTSPEELLANVCSDYIGVHIPRKWTENTESIDIDRVRFVFWFDN